MKYEIPKLFTISLIAQRITRYVDGHSRSIEPCRKCDGSICIVIYTNVTKHIACENKKEYFLRKSVMLTQKWSIWEPADDMVGGIILVLFLVKGVFINDDQAKKRLCSKPFFRKTSNKRASYFLVEEKRSPSVSNVKWMA